MSSAAELKRAYDERVDVALLKLAHAKWSAMDHGRRRRSSQCSAHDANTITADEIESVNVRAVVPNGLDAVLHQIETRSRYCRAGVVFVARR